MPCFSPMPTANPPLDRPAELAAVAALMGNLPTVAEFKEIADSKTA